MKKFRDTHNTAHVPNIAVDMRAAFGPGYQFGGPTDVALRTITHTNR